MEPKKDTKPSAISRSEKADCKIDIRIDAKRRCQHLQLRRA
jgi:hypothetical protein